MSTSRNHRKKRARDAGDSHDTYSQPHQSSKRRKLKKEKHFENKPNVDVHHPCKQKSRKNENENIDKVEIPQKHSHLNQMAYDNKNATKNQLLDMGYDEYAIDLAIKYVQMGNNNNNNDILMNVIGWLSNHEITEYEKTNNKILKLCHIIECPRYEALNALKTVQNNVSSAINLLVTNKENNNLSDDDISNLQMEDSILLATLQSIHDERQKEQKWIKIRPLISAELRSMGFLQIIVFSALNAKNVKDKKSAIQYILSHPLNKEQEKNAKIEEITNSGYTQNDANLALNKFSMNLQMSTSWLMQNKPLKIKHFMYHVETKYVLQIGLEYKDDDNKLIELNSDINLKNVNQHWSLYENGKIKNFSNNKCLIVCGDKENEKIHVINDDEMKNKNDIFYKWEINENDRTIKNIESGLYLVYRNKFYLEKTIHSGDMAQRWCFVDDNELTKINPNELIKILDDEYECIICFDNEPNIRIEPCGHSSFCKQCINELKPTQCPICRTKIYSTRGI